MQTPYRIGQIVPSSNTTMETEIPAMLTARQLIRPERFTFHSSRMRMKTVKKEEKSPIKSNISADDVAKVAYFLMSDYSSAITGQTIYVDNGFNIIGY